MSDDLATELGKLDYPGDATSARMLGLYVALAGEVFVLKAQVERLTRALEAAGVTDAARLAAAGAAEDMTRWLASEEKAYARGLLAPWLAPDSAVNATAFMREN